MFADMFSKSWIEQEESTPDITNDPNVPVVIRIEGFAPMQVKKIHTDHHEDDGSKTIWITAEEM